MRKEKLTLRQKKIIEILAYEEKNMPITISYISEKLQVSTRTILREMPYVEKWIKDKKFKLIKKPGVGLKIEENLEEKKKLLDILKDEDLKKIFSKDERKEIILDELLKSTVPLKKYYFTSLLNISEGTLSGDLYQLEDYLKDFNVNIKRKQGVGIYLEGNIETYKNLFLKN